MPKPPPAPTPAPTKQRQHTWLPPLAAALTHAALLIAAFPPFNLWPCAILALAPLTWLLQRPTARPWREAAILMLGVAPAWLVWEWWMIGVTAPGFPFFILLQCSWTALFFGVTRRLRTRFPRIPLAILAPITWVAVEFFRGEYFLSGYASGLLAYPFIELPRMAAPAAWLGVYFVCFLAACIGAAIPQLFIRHLHKPAAITALSAILIWAAALLLVPRGPLGDNGAPPRITRPGILQTNVPQSNKIAWGITEEIDDWKRFEQRTRALAASRPDFILWPETMMPGDTLEPAATQALTRAGVGTRLPDGKLLPAGAFPAAITGLQQELAIPMLVGEDALVNVRVDQSNGNISVKWDTRYNSAYLINDGRIQPVRYDKVCLTPFGETMPFISHWPWLQNQLLTFGAHGMSFDLAAGSNLTVFSVPPASGGEPVRIVTPICFEVTVAHHLRELVFEGGHRRADLIANLTNDGWFGESIIARQQHLQIARWRCVELATPMARAANTGISTLIDCDGVVLAAGIDGSNQQSHVEGILSGQLALCTRTTLFARVGNVFPGFITVLTAAALAASFFRRRGPGNAEILTTAPANPQS